MVVKPPSERVYTRLLSDTEIAYYLPSRESGVNDMYLHLGFLAPAARMKHSRVLAVLAIMRLRHPLLASKILMSEGDYHNIRFQYTPPESVDAVLEDAKNNLEYRNETKDVIIDSYLNGPRTISNDRLAYLIVGNAEESRSALSDIANGTFNYDLLIAAAHFTGDGMALHTFANDFFNLLGGPTSEEGLLDQLKEEWSARRTDLADLIPGIEDRFPPQPKHKFKEAVDRVNFIRDQGKDIGGHSFPRVKGKERHTIVPTVSFDEVKTKAILKACKAHGVSISAALFAVCNIAWARTQTKGWELPTMMYSALNLRPSLKVDPRWHKSYHFVAIGYFNVVLPTFLPTSGSVEQTFWLRAQSAKVQSGSVAKSKFLVSRSLLMAQQRASNSRTWAKEDDDRLRGVVPAPKPPTQNPPQTSSTLPKAPSTALIGLSLLGNLDGIYQHAKYADIKLHTLTTGSRQRQGGMLLFGYTFAGKLWVSLGYDENGLEETTIKTFWKNCFGVIEEILLK